MNIAVDGRVLQGKTTGIGKYVDQVLSALSKIDKENSYYIFFNYKDISEVKNYGQNFQNVKVPFFKIILEQIWFPVLFRKYKIDLYFSPNHVLPIIKNSQTVVVIHDLAHLYFPQSLPKKAFWYYQTFIPGSLKRADRIIAISESTKSDIVKFFDIESEKIKVLYPGVEKKKFEAKISKEHRKKIRNKLNLSNDYLLTIGIFEFRKNYQRLIQAFNNIAKRFPELKLVMAGPKSKDFPNIQRLVQQYNLSDRVIFPGYLRQEEIITLYQEAKLFVFPSLYEGFGIPPLEAMAAGTPVVASCTSSIPEVVGNAAVLFDPKKPEAISKAIIEVLKDKNKEKQLILAGKKRVNLSQFDWCEVGKKTLEIFQALE